MFFVITIHTKTVKNVQIGVIDGSNVDFIINTFARFAVPFFFVVSGYLFIQKMKSIAENEATQITKKQWRYFKKYTLKLTKLWIAWFAFYFLFDLAVKWIETEKTSNALQAMIGDYVGSVFTWETLYYGAGHSQYHLWFLLALIWSAITLFIFFKLKSLPALLILSLGLNLYGLFGQSYTAIFEVPFNTRDALFYGLFYTALGGMFSKYIKQLQNVAMQIPNKVYLQLLIGLFALQLIEGFITIRLLEGNEENYFFATIPLTVILFLTIMKNNQMGKNTIISKIGANAVGIYVSHVFIMKSVEILMQRLNLADVQETLLWNIAFTPMLFIIAYLFYATIQKAKGELLISQRRLLEGGKDLGALNITNSQVQKSGQYHGSKLKK